MVSRPLIPLKLMADPWEVQILREQVRELLHNVPVIKYKKKLITSVRKLLSISMLQRAFAICAR